MTKGDVEKLFDEIHEKIDHRGYYLNPDREFVFELLEGLLTNEGRYGYQACPCRLATGNIEKDRDLICPCDYRDDDLAEYGACYCALYVDKDIYEGNKEVTPVPERRRKNKEIKEKEFNDLSYPVYRCKVCGYLMAKDQPPNICPICGVDKERFERFI